MEKDPWKRWLVISVSNEVFAGAKTVQHRVGCHKRLFSPLETVAARALHAFPAALQLCWHGPITFQKGHECVHTILHCNTLTWETQHKYNLYSGRRVLWAGVEFMGKV